MKVIYEYANETLADCYGFHCPGCGYEHSFRTKGKEGQPKWTWNGDFEKPTISPSLLVFKDDPTRRCHIFVNNGMIQYLSDCFHDMKNKTIPMVAID